MPIILFDCETDWRAAIDATLARAEREVRLFDDDLRSVGLETPERVQRLGDFLAADRSRRLKLVLMDLDHLQRYCPRLLGLLRLYSHAIETRLCPEHLRSLADRYLLADACHGAIRFHADQPRGKRVEDDAAELRPWWDRFDELWLESAPVAPGSTLGL